MQSQLSMGLFRLVTSNVMICMTKLKPSAVLQLSSFTYVFSISFRSLSLGPTARVCHMVCLLYCNVLFLWGMAACIFLSPRPSRATVQLFAPNRRSDSRTQHFPFYPASVFTLLEMLFLYQFKSHSQFVLIVFKLSVVF